MFLKIGDSLDNHVSCTIKFIFGLCVFVSLSMTMSVKELCVCVFEYECKRTVSLCL